MLENLLPGLAIIGLMLALLLTRLPIAFALAAAGMVGLVAARPWRAVEFLLSTFTYSATANFAYIVLPLFLFMGQMAFSAGLSRHAFNAGQKWLGRVPGGLAAATVFGCAAFSTICGSSVATASTMARVALPEMLRKGYSGKLAAGCIAAGGTLGVLIPPSGILVVYSIATNVSLVKLFVAALVPGILTAIIYVIGIIIWVKLRPEIAPNPKSEPKPSWGERFNALGSAWELAILFAAVMGTIYLGVATATEAAALGALFALIAVIRRPGRKRAVLEGLRDTGTATCSIFALVIGAGLFSLGLSTTGFPTHLASLVVGLNLSQTGTIVLVLLPFLILGCFVDGLSMILIMMPIVFPIVQRVGFDGVLFGLLVVKMVEIGAITPPVGLNVFVVKSMAPNVELRDMFYGCIPFVILELMIVALLIAFPQIALFAVSD
ncbi:TRAP transporter large permease [Reyranella sp.]|jgi:tripartite ATP-independent transporter DctM subunit|uniref:TRAP transporter large permease n=1 Tax=Reyranella sp. TaxID=1929291 RepID=UPI000BCFE291|nr:TRAP transporter large permease [Reyranella sp.]OYY44883.1 MAG: TRAP dicarboxylate transporter subunit DctM [Rhodospirillales bacterium 35-66-84]OYZ95279.1 MAG: TRAP dicarboxylate transporter subunit DctM [Rhodospirillales bacterium 24-66-33]OZB26946.1 MAG: TRAP dicarboxylate transporter subunit DctM [Rhodospirillales bacterium 39-66-50]HQT11733.1 TRAP transporter large permease [Reyranella sp.]